MPGYVLSENDGAVLRQLVDRERQRQHNLRTRDAPPDQDGQASDVYIAHVPAAGIPAMTSTGGAGTGSPALHGDVPGSAQCAVYRRLPGRMIPVGLNLTVYNYSTTAVTGNKWIPVAKEKFGDWTALSQQAGSGGTSTFSGAQYYISASQSIPDATATQMTYDQNYFDTDTYYDGTGQFVAPVDGYYLFGGSVAFATGANAATLLALSAQLTAGSFNASYDVQIAGTIFGPTDTPPLTTSGMFNLLAGDTVALSVFQNSGAALNIIRAFAWITKLGNV